MRFPGTRGRPATILLVAACFAATLFQGESVVAGPGTQTPGAASSDAGQLVQNYCITCHTEQQRSAGNVPIALDTVDAADIGANAEIWEQVVRKMRAGLMPPSGSPRPGATDLEAFAETIEAALDRTAAANPNPGRTEPLHRLNRVEYQNAVRDLLDLEVDVSALLPADDASYGFDNIAGVLGISPTLMERYLAAAEKISRVAVGTPPLFPDIDYFRVADDLAQDDHLPGFSLGTRGGTLIRYPFPMDGEYTIRAQLTRDLNESLPVYADPQHLEVSIDGQLIERFTVPGVGSPPPPAPAPATEDSSRPQISQIARGPRLSPAERAARNRIDDDWEVRVPVQAGTRDVQVAFVKISSAEAETIRLPFERPYPAGVNIPETRLGVHLRSVEISGPYDVTGAGESPSRHRIFSCSPTDLAEEDPCAEEIILSLARRAWRRPVSPPEVGPLLEFYREGRSEGSFDDGIELAVRRLLVSPEFLFRVARDPEEVPAGTPYEITDLELASRLSFFLWSSIPDEELLNLAEAGRLRDRGVLADQVVRMVTDQRFESFISNFAGQWLFLRNLEAAVPVQSIFPDFDDTLRQGFRRETELFFGNIVREGGGAFDLLDADYTFLNERLATHYDIPNVKGSHFRRVELGEGSVRGGILGHGSVLTVTSYPDRTSPVVRGKWILENLLGAPPPAPPANVPELEATDNGGDVLSMRERMIQHRANPVCASCHAMMDPLGLALENFNGIGQWRTLGESGLPIDAEGALPDGTPFDGMDGLRNSLLDSELFVVTLTEKMLTYALGRGLEHYDAPAVRGIVRRARGDEYKLTTLIQGVVESLPFQMRMKTENP